MLHEILICNCYFGLSALALVVNALNNGTPEQ